MKQTVDSKYDVVIIGSGIGGLVLGALLSKDKKVLLIEKNNNFGGYCSGFLRGEFNFEVAVEAINGLKKGQTIYKLFEEIGILEPSLFIKPKYLYRSIYDEFDLRVPQNGEHKYIELLYSLFSKQKRNIDQLFAEMELIYKEIDMLDKTKSLKKCPKVLEYSDVTVEELLDKYISDEKLKTVISQYWLYCGLPPSKLSSVTFSYIWYDYTFNGGYYPEKGMGEVARRCIDVIKRNGGEAINNSEVTKIYNENDKAVGIEVGKSKERINADVFVSNIDIARTLDMLSEKNKKITSFIHKIKEKETSISAFKIYLGLNVSLKKLGIDDYEIFINPGYDMDEMYYKSLQNLAKEVPFSLTIYSNISDNFCKDNKSVVTITMLAGYDFWESLEEEEYKSTKEKMADILIKRCEKIIPKLSNYIEVKEIATPLTMKRYTGNKRGAIYGWSKENLYDEIRFMRNTTPLKNLFLSSHWTKIGGGVAGVLRTAERTYRLLGVRG